MTMKATMTVTLSAAPNPDHPTSRHEGRVCIPQTFALCEDVADASRICREFIEKHDLGGGNWTGGRVAIPCERIMGHVAYNGKVFTEDRWEGREYVSGECLYVPE